MDTTGNKENKAPEAYRCPNCGEEENLHFNYDYENKVVIDVLCNECETFFLWGEPYIKAMR